MSSSWRFGEELEVLDMEAPEAEDSKAGGPGARAMGRGDREDYSGALRCPTRVEKVIVILASLKVREREVFDFTPRSQ